LDRKGGSDPRPPADIEDRKAVDDMDDELQKVTRLMEESEANQQGTCVPE